MSNKLTAQQAVKYCILQHDADFSGICLSDNLDGKKVDDLFESSGCLQDATNEVRQGVYKTHLPCEDSRNYESESVCAKAPNGQWVGWTCWSGGGKHGNPEEIDWIEDAYFLDVKETEKVVTVMEFSKL